MDSCAISPTALLFVEYTEKKTSVFQIQLEFWVNMTLASGWCTPPPHPLEKLDFVQVVTFPIFPHQKWLRMTQNGQFHLNSQLFQSFPTKVAQNDLEWQILPNLQLFQSFPTEVAHNDSEQPILPNLQLFQSFPTRSGSEWLWIANFAWFATFPIFSHQSGSEWLGTANFARFATFPIFSHWSGSEWLKMANFAQLATFPIFSHHSGSEWLGMANSAKKKKHYDTREFLWKITILHGQLCDKSYSFLVCYNKGCYHREPGDMWVELYQ